MRFSLDEDQLALRDAVGDLLSSSTVDSWAGLAGMGLFGAAVAVPAGGLGLTETDLVPVLVELGYAAVPEPVAETMFVAAPLSPELASGRTRVALNSTTVLYGLKADLVLDISPSSVRLVAPTDRVAVATVDESLAAARVTLPGGGVLTTEPGLVAVTADRAALAYAAQLLGLGRRMLDLTTSYVVQRRQFGAPVGSFQAVKHRLADALLRLEFALPAVLAAGWALTQGTPTAGRDVSVAVVLAVEAAQETAKAAIQCHGAIGYTVEYELHRYAKRAWALAAACRFDAHLDRLADTLELKGAAT